MASGVLLLSLLLSGKMWKLSKVIPLIQQRPLLPPKTRKRGVIFDSLDVGVPFPFTNR